MTTRADPNRVFATLARDRVKLALETTDLCFVAALHLQAEQRAIASFDETMLVDTFEQVCDAVEPGVENPRLRATHAIQRLRTQKLLARVDGGLLGRQADYALTRLGAAIIEFYLADDALTQESLSLLSATLSSHLAQVLAQAKLATTPEEWRKAVAPLRVTVTDIVLGIERRQRGLDSQQEEVRAEIAHILSVDWFTALDRCQALLETTTSTLRELNEVLARDSHHFTTLLLEIQAHVGDDEEADAAVQRVLEQVDRIGAWGMARMRNWSEYYQYVHGYLRDVVRLDPDRALSQRLREQLASFGVGPFFMVVGDEPVLSLLRRVDARVERPPVSRPHLDRELSPEVVAPVDFQVELENLVGQALDDGAATLEEVTRLVLAKLPPALHYVSAGRVAEAVARQVEVWSLRERPWRRVERLELEDWELVAP